MGSAEAGAWPARARGHLALARGPRPEGAFWEDLCFQAQQAAEKAIKAACLLKGVPFRFVHDIEELAGGLADRIPIPPALREAAVLTRYAVETRYPGAAEPVSEEEYRETLRLAEAVVSWVEGLVEGDARRR